MTGQQTIEDLRQMLADWDALTEPQRQAALKIAADRAAATRESNWVQRARSNTLPVRVEGGTL